MLSLLSQSRVHLQHSSELVMATNHMSNLSFITITRSVKCYLCYLFILTRQAPVQSQQYKINLYCLLGQLFVQSISHVLSKTTYFCCEIFPTR